MDDGCANHLNEDTSDYYYAKHVCADVCELIIARKC